MTNGTEENIEMFNIEIGQLLIEAFTTVRLK